MKNTYILTASNVSLDNVKQSKRHMTVSMRMFSTKANLNGVAVTEAFIDRIIENKQEYICMPLCADVRKLKNGDYRGLGHMFDRRTGKYLAEEVGSFFDFEKVNDEYGASLFGTARINKRSDEVSNAILELFARGELNFSFEIEAERITVEEGVTIVDADEGNELMGMAIVYYPACPEANAVAQVAEDEHTKAMNAAFENVNIMIAEMDFDTIRSKIWEILERMSMDDGRWYDRRVLLLCPDCAVCYDDKDGSTFKIEYIVDDGELKVTDWYDVKFVRAEGDENDMDKDKVLTAEHEEMVCAEENENKDAPEQCNAECKDTDDCKKDDNCDDCKDSGECKGKKQDAEAESNKKIAELEALIAELTPYKEREEAAKHKAEVDKLIAFAQKNGLDATDEKISAAIEALDYATQMAESLNASAKDAAEKTTAGASLRLSSEIGVGDPYGGLLARE